MGGQGAVIYVTGAGDDLLQLVEGALVHLRGGAVIPIHLNHAGNGPLAQGGRVPGAVAARSLQEWVQYTILGLREVVGGQACFGF